MVISFEEKDRKKIEATGMSVIEFKRNLYGISKTISDIWILIEDVAEKIEKAWNLFKEKFFEAIGKMKMAIEIINDSRGYHTSFRYKIVKMISKCTGINQWKVWNMTRNTWLARCSI